MVDSLTFDWLDSAGFEQHYVVNSRLISLDSSNSRKAHVSLGALSGEFALLTEAVFGEESFGNFRMYLHDGTTYDLTIKDKMAPLIGETFLKSFRGKSNDTLSVVLTERVKVNSGCENLFEFKSRSDSSSYFRKPSGMTWYDGKTAQFVFEYAEGSQDLPLLPGDSIRLTPKCFEDTSKNLSASDAPFQPINGFYPLEMLTSSMVYGEEAGEDLPIFQTLFEDDDADVPNENRWGIALDVLGPEFENAVRDALGFGHKMPLDLSKLKIHLNVRIYTNLGAFVASTSDDVSGDDPRFENSAKRLFLKWNLMDHSHRKVGTGAYISNAAVIVTYDGRVVFRNDIHHGSTAHAFGVKRN